MSLYNSSEYFLHTSKGTPEQEDGRSSTETLSAEERETLSHMQRQEPQGQEQAYGPHIAPATLCSHEVDNVHDLNANLASAISSRNNESNLSFGSNTNTLIIHHSVPDESWSHRWLSNYSAINKSTREHSLPAPTMNDTSSGGSFTRPTEVDNNSTISEVLKHLMASESPQSSTSHAYNQYDQISHQARLSDQSGVSGGSSSVGSGTARGMLLSKSQPDLTRVGMAGRLTVSNGLPEQGVAPWSRDDDLSESLSDFVDALNRDNSALKVELEVCHRKVARLQRFEASVCQLESQYEALVKQSEKRELLERFARHKLQQELRKLAEMNAELKEQITGGGDVSVDAASISALKKELNKRDVIIAQLLNQNKEISATIERQTIELNSQRQTMKEQRSHIGVLDMSRNKAQTTALQLEEELNKKRNSMDQAEHLKRLLMSLKMSSDRREQAEKNLRHQLHIDLMQLRSANKLDPPWLENADLRKDLREKEEKVMKLESELALWETRFRVENPAAAQRLSDTTVATTASTPRNRSLEIVDLRDSANQSQLSHFIHLPTQSSQVTQQVTPFCQQNRQGEQKVAGHNIKVDVASSFAPPGVPVSYAAPLSGPRKDEELGEILL